jgi:hypothetical protein
VIVTLLACARFDGNPLLEVDSDHGLLHVEVRSDPQPPVLGVTRFQFVVTDPDGAPVPDLDLTVVPYMPEMDMGPAVQPEVRARRDGVYEIDRVDLVMEGTWELDTDFAGAVEDSVAPSFDVSASSP